MKKEIDNLVNAAENLSEVWAKFIDSFDYYPGVGDRVEDIEFKEMAKLRSAVKSYKEGLRGLNDER